MFRRNLRALVAVTALVSGSEAFGFFDGQVLVGKRWYEMKQDGEKSGVASQEVALAGHIDIPMLPLAAGVSIAMGTLDKDDLGDGVTGSVFEPALDLMGWVPLVPIVTPYARIKIPIAAKATIKGDVDFGEGEESYEFTESISGFDLGVGVKWSPVPIVKLLVELQRGMEKFKPEELKVGGTKDDSLDKTSITADSNAFFVGVEIGL